MKFNQDLEQIKQNYVVVEKTRDMAEIVVDKMLNNFSRYYIAVYEENGKTYLNDLANTCEIVDLDEQTYTNICLRHGLSFNDWHIECEYTNNQDIEKFISCIDEIVALANK